MRNFFILIFIFCTCSCFAQKLAKRSSYERRWAFAHPFAALKTKKIYRKCLPFYLEIKKAGSLDTCENGGKLDAFRHSYFMAAFTQKISVKKIRKLGMAHEKGNYKMFLKGIKEDGELADSLSTVMDLHNNELVFKIGPAHPDLDYRKLRDQVAQQIFSGQSLFFKRNQRNQYVTCEGELIILDDYKGKWFIPKCLISSVLK